MSMTLRQLRSLLTLARVESFTRAAQELNISQPALTVQINELEEATGVRLIDRNTHFVKLTAAGKQAVPVIQEALAAIDGVLAKAKLEESSTAAVTAAALPSLCSEILPSAIAWCRKRYPGITVHLLETGARRVPSYVVEEEAELGFGLLERPHPKLDTAPFITEPVVVVCPVGHPLGQKRIVVPADLGQFSLIAFTSAHQVRTLLESTMHSCALRLSPVCEVDSVSTAIGMVRAGLGITVVSASSVSRVSMTGLRAHPIKHPALVRGVVVMRKKGRTLSPAAEHFLTAVYAVRDGV